MFPVPIRQCQERVSCFCPNTHLYGVCVSSVSSHLSVCSVSAKWLMTPTVFPQSPGPEKAQNNSKETSPVLLHTETLPDGNFAATHTEQRHTHNNSADSLEQQQPPRFPSGRQASLPDVPSSSGMLGLHRPVSDPGLPGK